MLVEITYLLLFISKQFKMQDMIVWKKYITLLIFLLVRYNELKYLLVFSFTFHLMDYYHFNQWTSTNGQRLKGSSNEIFYDKLCVHLQCRLFTYSRALGPTLRSRSDITCQNYLKVSNAIKNFLTRLSTKQ